MWLWQGLGVAVRWLRCGRGLSYGSEFRGWAAMTADPVP